MYQPEELKERYKGLRISSLSYFRISPKYCKDRMDEVIEDLDTSYFDLGTKVHYFVLEPNKFNDLYIYLDFPVPKSEQQKNFCEEFAKLAEKQSEDKAAIEIYKKYYSADKKSDQKILSEAMKIVTNFRKYISYISKADVYKDTINYTTFKFLEDAKNCMLQHKKARELMTNSLYSTSNEISNDDYVEENEARIYWEYPNLTVNGESIVCRSTLDRLTIDHVNKVVRIVDLKTTSSLSKFEEKFKEYGYNEQLAFYWMAVGYMFSKLYPDKKLSEYKKETYIVALQTNTSASSQYPVECKVFNVEEKWLTEGLASIESTLKKMIWHFENNRWEYSREYYEGDGTEVL
jgi:hypothetical protein